MRIIPAIDIKDGKCVRLYKGDFDTVHKVADDALSVLNDFIRAGARLIHVVDLDGALHGERKNAATVGMIARAAGESGAEIELGGGIRTLEDIRQAEKLGVGRFIIGSAAVENPDFVSEAVRVYGKRIVVGVDAKDGDVMTHGWTRGSGVRALDFARSMEALGVGAIIYTDIDTDGMLTGPPLEKLAALRKAVACEIVASGGVSGIEDIAALRDLGIDSAIVGKAYYAGKIDLAEAIKTGSAL